MVLWDVITYSSVDLDKHFEGTVSWNIASSALSKFSHVEIGSIEPGNVVCVIEVVCLTVCVRLDCVWVRGLSAPMHLGLK